MITPLARPLLATLALSLFVIPAHSAEDLPTAAPEAVGLSETRLNRLTEAMQTYVDDGALAGARREDRLCRPLDGRSS